MRDPHGCSGTLHGALPPCQCQRTWMFAAPLVAPQPRPLHVLVLPPLSSHEGSVGRAFQVHFTDESLRPSWEGAVLCSGSKSTLQPP